MYSGLCAFHPACMFQLITIDIDECATNQDNCSDRMDCRNTNGSYECTCKEGYNFSMGYEDECQGIYIIIIKELANNIHAWLTILYRYQWMYVKSMWFKCYMYKWNWKLHLWMWSWIYGEWISLSRYSLIITSLHGCKIIAPLFYSCSRFSAARYHDQELWIKRHHHFWHCWNCGILTSYWNSSGNSLHLLLL